MDRCVVTVCVKENERLPVMHHVCILADLEEYHHCISVNPSVFFLLRVCGKTEYIASNSVQYLCQIIDFGSWFVWKTKFRIDFMPLSSSLCCPFTSLVL